MDLNTSPHIMSSNREKDREFWDKKGGRRYPSGELSKRLAEVFEIGS